MGAHTLEVCVKLPIWKPRRNLVRPVHGKGGLAGPGVPTIVNTVGAALELAGRSSSRVSASISAFRPVKCATAAGSCRGMTISAPLPRLMTAPLNDLA